MRLTGHKRRAIFDRDNIIHEQELLGAGDQLVASLAQHAQTGETLGQEAQPRAGKTRSPPRPPPAHGARSRRCGHTPATPPHKAAHTATGGASGRNRSRSPGMVADGGLNGARRRPSRN